MILPDFELRLNLGHCQCVARAAPVGLRKLQAGKASWASLKNRGSDS